MIETQEVAANQLMVLGGGISLNNGQAHLKSWSNERVDRTIGYYQSERDRFLAGGAVIVCTGGYSAGQSAEEIPNSQREASLMADRLMQYGIPAALIETETESTSTLENLLNVIAAGYIEPHQINRENPLGVVSHPHHLERFVQMGRKMGIYPDTIQKIAANREDEAFREFVTRQLYKGILFGAHDPATLRRREHRVLSGLGSARPVLRSGVGKLSFRSQL